MSWIEGFARERPGFRFHARARGCSPRWPHSFVRAAKTMQIGASSSRSILDSVATRIDEARDITRYIVNLLIFLGLLGTFFGLATTVPAVVETIRFARAPPKAKPAWRSSSGSCPGSRTSSKAWAWRFSSSLLGLAGSLVVAFSSSSRATGRTASIANSKNGSPRSPGSASRRRAKARAARRTTARSRNSPSTWPSGWDALQEFLLEDAREDRLGEMAGAIRELTDKLEGGQGTASALTRLGQSQQRLADLLEAQAQVSGGWRERASTQKAGMRLRSMDVQLLRILERTGGRASGEAFPNCAPISTR